MTNILDIFDRKDKLKLFFLLLLFIVSGIIEVLGIASVAPFIALLTKPEYLINNALYLSITNAYQLTNLDATVLMGSLVIILFATSNIVTAYTLWKTVSFTALQQHKISMVLMTKYLYQPYEFYTKNSSSYISKNILHETGVVCDLVILPSLQFISKCAVVLSVSIFLLYINYQIFIGTILILAIIYILIYSKVKETLLSYGENKVLMNKDKYKYVNDAFTDIKNIKFYSAEQSYLNLFSNPTKQFAELTAKSTLLSVLPRYILEVIAFGGIFTVLVYFLSKDYNLIAQSPVIGVFIIAAYRALPLLQQIYQNFAIYKFNSPVVEIIKNIYDLPVKKNIDTTEVNFSNNIILEDISFSYDDKKILSNINLEIKKSNIIAIVGESGLGKTTLIDIILGFHLKFNGKIFIDGVLLNNENLISLRKKIGYVSQDMSLTNMSLENNVAFGIKKSDIDYDMLTEILTVVELDHFVASLDHKYESILAERGMNISGGQKQRILLARALYRKPEILILDETTSSFNEELENKIIENIKKYLPDITIVLITHRLSSLKYCNNVFRLSKNKISEIINN
jgi:ABC-type bacteriocin/lantibiotic exporter with double-glycine peptidase domain